MPDFLSQIGGRGFRWDASYENSPESGTIGTLHQMRGTEVPLERSAKTFGAITIEERSGLDAVPALGGSGGNRKYVEADLGDTGADERDGNGRGMRKIDDAVVNEGSAVGDADVDRFVVREIDDAHPGSERQRAVRGSEGFHVVDLAVGGGASVIRMSIPTGESGFAVLDFSGDGAR